MTFDAMIHPIIDNMELKLLELLHLQQKEGSCVVYMWGIRFERETGIGFSVNAPTGGESSIHGHPLVRNHGGGHSPFSPGDVSWYGTTPGAPHFLTTPSGVFRFDGASSPVEQIGR